MATDIQTENLIFRISPAPLHPYIKLARLDRPIGTWLLLFPCWWSIAMASGDIWSMTAHEWRIALAFTVGSILMRGAGCVVNDLWDRKLDAQVERTRTRPLPSGEVTPRQAFIFLGILLASSLGILLTLNKLAIGMGVLSLLLVGTYPLMKRVTWWPQLFLGFTFNWGALMGWAAIKGSFAGPLLTLPPLWLYIGGIFWTLAYDTIYAHQDKEDDATIGIKSTALLWGKNSGVFVGACFGLALLCLAVARYESDPGGFAPILFLPLIGQVLWQMKDWNMHSPENCLKVFRANRWFGWLALVAVGV